jgi:hypothetical protein
MKEALSSFETSILTRATGVTSQKTAFFIVTQRCVCLWTGFYLRMSDRQSFTCIAPQFSIMFLRLYIDHGMSTVAVNWGERTQPYCQDKQIFHVSVQFLQDTVGAFSFPNCRILQDTFHHYNHPSHNTTNCNILWHIDPLRGNDRETTARQSLFLGRVPQITTKNG